MATAPITIAPVFTPRTIAALASAVQADHPTELWSALKGFEPFLEDVVQKFFVPLCASNKKKSFKGRFNNLSQKYEPFRLYIVLRLIGFSQNADLFTLYGRILRDKLTPLLNAARELDMAPELIAALIRDYLHLFELAKAATGPAPQDLTFERFSLLVDSLHKATRFDYGITATFLVLEGSIPEPTANDKVDLLTECKASLFELGKALIQFLDFQDGDRILNMFESNKLEISGSGKRLRVVPHTQGGLPKHPIAPRRQTEIDWIRQNTQISQEHWGKWIVIENDQLIASDKDYGRARAAAKERGIKRPFIVFVPSTPTRGFMGI